MSINSSEDDINLEAIYGIKLEITVVLGKALIPVSQLLKLSKGSVIELDRNIGEAVDIYINDRLVAKGEVVIVENKIGITLTEIIKTLRDK